MELGVECIAITEHQNVDSMAAAEQCARRYPQIRYVRAVELTLAFDGGEYDVLCYGLPKPLPKALRAAIQIHHDRGQRDASAAILDSLTRAGIPMSREQYRQLLAEQRQSAVLRKQGQTLLPSDTLAKWLMERRFIAAQSDYVRLMRSVAWPPYPAPEDTIPLFRRAGALIVLAHPHRYFRGADERRMDQLREAFMLDGIECAHPRVPVEYTPVYEAYCRKHRLLATGGSDSHHVHDLSQLFARHCGCEAWLRPLLERLDR